jgi:hypothetical protein
MKKFVTLAAVASALALAAPASAQVWQSINQRQANLESRIDAGVRNGSLTRPEAASLRSQFRGLAYLEARYRRSGGRLTIAERADLDRRFDNLSAQIRYQRHDHQSRGWQPINARQRDLEMRINQGLRNGSLSRTEAYRLRLEFNTIARIEASYRRNGLSAWERRDLDQRMDRLNARVFAEERDRNNYYG